MFDEDSLRKLLNVTNIPTENRASDLAIRAISIHALLTEKMGKNESVDLIVCIGGREFGLKSVGPFFGDTIYIESVEMDGSRASFLAPVEQVSFKYVVSTKTSDVPPREIGFKDVWEPEAKKD